MKKVVIECPYDGKLTTSKQYTNRCIRDCLWRDEAPLVSHLFYIQADTSSPILMDLCLRAALSWIAEAELTVVYQDYGITESMKVGIKRAKLANCPIEYRKIL